MLKNRNTNDTPFVVPEDVLESIGDTMAYLDILKDKNFYDYLLQSLTDHYAKLLCCENDTMRPEFTKEFFASYWMYLMKSVGYDDIPPVTLEDHHGRITNGFDSIVHSIFGVCENKIDLRVTTLFAFNGKELDDEKEIHSRTAFMLVLLFLSEWIADQKDECPHVTLKEPKSRLVHACFNKLFKNIYHGNNEGFKAYIFDEESSLPSFGFPKGSIISSIDLSSTNDSPASEQMVHDETKDESLIGPLSQTTDALLKAPTLKSISGEKLLAKSENIEAELNAKTTELMKEKENVEQSFFINDMEDLVCQTAEIFKEKKSLVGAIAQDECTVTSIKIEEERLSEDNEVTFEEEKQVLQEDVDEKIMELKNYGNFVEEKKVLELDLTKTKLEIAASNNPVLQKEEEIQKLLNEMDSLYVTNGILEKEYDAINEELSAVKLEANNLKEINGAFKEEKQALQNALDEKTMKLETVKRMLSKVQKELHEVVKQVRGLYSIKSENETELAEFKVHFDDSNASVVEKLAEMKTLSFVNDNISNINTPALSDEENVSEIISDTFYEHLDSGIASSEQTSEINTTTAEVISIIKQSFSSLLSSWLMFFISLFFFVTIQLFLWGAIIPVWVRLELQHDHLPPQ
uniref:Uncharacterized protein n=1 Tax=Panagrolaimus sp. PS1159 TaxID=55785 RepID=A0AC35FE30_9BILA